MIGFIRYADNLSAWLVKAFAWLIVLMADDIVLLPMVMMYHFPRIVFALPDAVYGR